jgi:hypothetical protein
MSIQQEQASVKAVRIRDSAASRYGMVTEGQRQAEESLAAVSWTSFSVVAVVKAAPEAQQVGAWVRSEAQQVEGASWPRQH